MSGVMASLGLGWLSEVEAKPPPLFPSISLRGQRWGTLMPYSRATFRRSVLSDRIGPVLGPV